MKSTLKKEDAARESTPRTTIEDSRAHAYGSEKPEARAIQRAIYGYHPGPFTWQTKRAVPKKYQRSIERFLVMFKINSFTPGASQLASVYLYSRFGHAPSTARLWSRDFGPPGQPGPPGLGFLQALVGACQSGTVWAGLCLTHHHHKRPASRILCLASGGCKLQQPRPWLGLVDLSRTPSGIFFREVSPVLETGYKHRQNRLFRVCVIWPQKHEKRVFTKARSQRAHFLFISPPPGSLCGPYFKVTARTNNGNLAVLFVSQRYKPHLANWQKMRLNSTVFRYSARSPHRATKPSRGWLRVVVRKPRLVLLEFRAPRN